MSNTPPASMTPAAEAFTDLLLESFRFHGVLLAAGDRLTKDLGLTSALWQVLGSLDAQPLTMAQIARDMGRTRQSVRRSVGILEQKGLVAARDNPDHQRAMLIALTPRGRRTLEEMLRRNAVWANAVAKGFDRRELESAARAMRALQEKL